MVSKKKRLLNFEDPLPRPVEALRNYELDKHMNPFTSQFMEIYEGMFGKGLLPKVTVQYHFWIPPCLCSPIFRFTDSGGKQSLYLKI